MLLADGATLYFEPESKDVFGLGQRLLSGWKRVAFEPHAARMQVETLLRVEPDWEEFLQPEAISRGEMVLSDRGLFDLTARAGGPWTLSYTRSGGQAHGYSVHADHAPASPHSSPISLLATTPPRCATAGCRGSARS